MIPDNFSNSDGISDSAESVNDSVSELLALLESLHLLPQQEQELRKEARGKITNKNAGGKELSKTTVASFKPAPPISLAKKLAALEEKLLSLEQQVYRPTDLIDPLLPLLKELLSLKTKESREAILEAVTPVLDELLEQRKAHQPEKMNAALGGLLPGAISQEILDEPKAIGKAIAPEIALALQEQSRIKRDSLSRALGPEMGKAIKVQIHEEKDAMIDALYPVIGNTISKYMVEMVASINEQVETALSFQGILRRIRAKIQGISEAELILKEAIDFEVQALFLIQKSSGLIIWEAQPSPPFRLDSDLVAGMLTAIREFATDCVTPTEKMSELHEIDFDGTTILLEVAGYCYLAAVITGEPSRAFLQNLRHCLGEIVLEYGDVIADFCGDPTTFPRSAQFILEKLIQQEAKTTQRKLPYSLLLLLLLPFLPIGFFIYRDKVASQLEYDLAKTFDKTPELSIYDLEPKVKGDNLHLTGRVPDELLKSQATQIAQKIAPDLDINNQISVVNIPATANEIRQMKNLFNLLAPRIYFDSNSSQLSGKETETLFPLIAQFMSAYPTLHLRIVGYTDRIGDLKSKEELGAARAHAVQQALIGQGISDERLEATSRLSLPTGLTGNSPEWLSRSVFFETFLPSE